MHGAPTDKDDDGEVFFDVAKLLMERGADVNASSINHDTPLHQASRLVSLKVAWCLLKYGADPNVKNGDGKTPFQLAREHIKEQMERSPSEYSTGRARRAQGVALMALLSGY